MVSYKQQIDLLPLPLCSQLNQIRCEWPYALRSYALSPCLNLFSTAYQLSNFRKFIQLVMYLNFFTCIIGIVAPCSQICLEMKHFNTCKALETVTGTCAFCVSVCFYFLLKGYVLEFMKNILFTKYTVFHVVTGKNSPDVISVLCLKTEVKVQTVLQERILLFSFLCLF